MILAETCGEIVMGADVLSKEGEEGEEALRGDGGAGLEKGKAWANALGYLKTEGITRAPSARLLAPLPVTGALRLL